MKKLILISLFFLMVSSLSAEVSGSSFLVKYMNEKNINGTVVVESLKTGKVTVYNASRAERRYLPASTFKIVNTLIALQENAVADEKEIIKWDGRDRGIAAWNMDHNISSAFPVSCVWFYQELAERIGNRRYLDYLKKMNYGNNKTGKNVESFWLDGDLGISAVEQIQVLKKVYAEKFPFERRYYAILKDLMIAEKNESYVLRGKTGTAVSLTPDVGWYVGYLETADDVWFFACNIDLVRADDAGLRKDAVITALKELKAIR